MTELITQNPILSLILAIATVTGVMWKIFHELFVKPRDFRIDMLKEDNARVSSQLEEFRNLRETRVITGQGHADGSSQIEARPTDSKLLEKPPLPIAQSTQGSKSPVDSLAVFYERWSDPSITKLQKQKFERDWTGKDVRWVVSVESVSEASHGKIFVSVRDGARTQFNAPRAFLIFTERDAEVLLTLQPDDPIVVTGKICDFLLVPMLDALTVKRAQ
jgi:hypothetical protein